MLIGVHAHVVHPIAQGSLEVRRHSGVEPPAAPARGRNRGFDVGVHQAAGENALTLLHARDESREVAIADPARRALETAAHVVHGLRRDHVGDGNRARPLSILL
jgi:hypothetical protein